MTANSLRRTICTQRVWSIALFVGAWMWLAYSGRDIAWTSGQGVLARRSSVLRGTASRGATRDSSTTRFRAVDPRQPKGQTPCDERLSDVPEFAFNPLEPMLQRPNHAVFQNFRVSSSIFDPTFVYEAFGVKVNQSYDCMRNNPDIGFNTYRTVCASRHFACRQHQSRIDRAAQGQCLQGTFPLVDDEYVEFVDVLLSVTEHDPTVIPVCHFYLLSLNRLCRCRTQLWSLAHAMPHGQCVECRLHGNCGAKTSRMWPSQWNQTQSLLHGAVNTAETTT